MDKREIYDRLNRCYFSDACHEKDVLEHLSDLLDPAQTFVDVGASLGQYTQFAARHIENVQVVAIEADPVRFEELERNAAIWAEEYGSTIQALHFALGDTRGKTTFFTTNSPVSGGLFPHPAPDKVQWETIEVPATTLDDLFPDEPPDLVKIDIEGGELRLMRGAQQILEKKRTLFLIELHKWEDIDGQSASKGTRRIMRRFGYFPVSFHGKSLFMPFGPTYLKLKTSRLLSIIARAAHLPLFRPVERKP